jgi:hypothetical protein
MTYTHIRADKELVGRIDKRRKKESRNKFLRRLLGLPPLKEIRGGDRKSKNRKS